MSKSVKAYFNKIAKKRPRLVRKNLYYNKRNAYYLSLSVPVGSSVLEIGSGSGYLLNALKPKRGVGIDFSPNMVAVAKKKYPHLEFITADAHDFDLSEKFDFIVISDTINYFDDIQQVFHNIRKNCHANTRILINSHNHLWDPLLNVAEFLGLKMKQPKNNWLGHQDIENLLNLEDFEVIKHNTKILFPKYIPLLSYFINRYIANLPLINNLNLVEYSIARPINIEKKNPETVSIVVAARNEKGNIEKIVQTLPVLGAGTELIFIEGGSSDNTWEEIIRIAKKYPEKNISYAKQDGIGKGDAVRKGFDMAKNDILMIYDADMTVPAKDLEKFYNAINQGKGDFINGTRLVYPMEKEAMRTFNLFGNKMFSIIFSWLFNQRIKDTLCGTKVIRKEQYNILKNNRSYFGNFDPFGDFDLLFGATKMNLKIVEVPIRYQERTYGSTNIDRIKHGIILVRMCLFATRKLKFI